MKKISVILIALLFIGCKKNSGCWECSIQCASFPARDTVICDPNFDPMTDQIRDVANNDCASLCEKR